MASTIILSDNGVSSGSAGLKETGGNDGVLILQTTTSGGTATNAVTVDNLQNVGIGVTPSTWTAFKAIEIGGNGAGIAGGAGQPVMFSNATYNGGWKYTATGAASNYDQNAGIHRWFYAASGTAGSAITFTEAMRIDTSGNVGIGTLPSGWKLNVKGIMNLEAISGSTNGWNVYTYTDNTLRFNYNGAGADEVTIDSGGSFWIGTTSSLGYSEKLAVAGTIATSGSQMNMASGADYEFVQRSGSRKFNFYVNGASVLATLSVTGVWTNASDARYKENIVDSTYGLDTVMALKPRAYNLIDQEDKPQIGFIAQEVLEVVPEVVDSEFNSITEEDRYTLSYGNLVAVLVKAIQEQQAIITTLTERITALEGAQA